MRHTIHKLFWAWNFEKEEKWLNEMSAKGLQLVDVGLGRYTFDEGDRGEYHYRIELLENPPNHAESISYIRFLEDAGVKHIGSFLRWVYFRKNAADGEFNLYSDLDSRIRHYRRISWLTGILGVLNAFLVPVNMLPVINGTGRSPSYVFLLNLFVAIVCLYGCFQIERKVHKLKKEKLIHE